MNPAKPVLPSMETGTELATASAGSTSISYAYDLGGLRTKKTVGTTAHNYIYASGKLLRETYGSNTLDFFYDNNGTPFALKHNGTLYYYVTNLQGDVMNLVDGSGNVVATYDYDPYGKVITSTGSMAEINPLRYRGYYYDTESGLYYLQSRYYDPAIGRFINADCNLSVAGGDILGNNFYSYCFNNPVNMLDRNGDWPEWIPLPEITYDQANGTELKIYVRDDESTVLLTNVVKNDTFPEQLNNMGRYRIWDGSSCMQSFFNSVQVFDSAVYIRCRILNYWGESYAVILRYNPSSGNCHYCGCYYINDLYTSNVYIVPTIN